MYIYKIIFAHTNFESYLYVRMSYWVRKPVV